MTSYKDFARGVYYFGVQAAHETLGGHFCPGSETF